MLNKRNRLPRPLFTQVLQGGKSVHGVHMSVRVMPAEHAAFSVVVSKKVARLAVTRNKLRRRLYAILESELEKTPPLFGVVITKTGASTLSFSALKEECESLFRKARQSLY